MTRHSKKQRTEAEYAQEALERSYRWEREGRCGMCGGELNVKGDGEKCFAEIDAQLHS